MFEDQAGLYLENLTNGKVLDLTAISALKEENESLKRRLETLEARLNALEKNPH
jgi:cell division protein FtsB